MLLAKLFRVTLKMREKEKIACLKEIISVPPTTKYHFFSNIKLLFNCPSLFKLTFI